MPADTGRVLQAAGIFGSPPACLAARRAFGRHDRPPRTRPGRCQVALALAQGSAHVGGASVKFRFVQLARYFERALREAGGARHHVSLVQQARRNQHPSARSSGHSSPPIGGQQYPLWSARSSAGWSIGCPCIWTKRGCQVRTPPPKPTRRPAAAPGGFCPRLLQAIALRSDGIRFPVGDCGHGPEPTREAVIIKYRGRSSP